MNISLGTHSISLAKAVMGFLGFIAAAGAAVAYGDNLWYRFGWMSPSTIDEMIVGEIKDFRDEWKCDEYQEELEDLLRRQQAGDTSVETAERVRIIRVRMGPPPGLSCARFE